MTATFAAAGFLIGIVVGAAVARWLSIREDARFPSGPYGW